jgi:hypothetical protein
MQPLLKDNGSGSLFVNTAGRRWSWEMCAQDLLRCAPFKDGRRITTAGAQPNSVFRVSGGNGVGLSPLWKGRVKSLAPPSARGTVRANELVTPIAGKWRGGWKGDFDQLQLAACATPDGRHCTTLTHSHYPAGCQDEGAVLDPIFAGRYLRVANRRAGPGTAERADAVTSPYGHEVWRRNRVTSIAIVGRIEEASGPRTSQCGPPPLSEEP